MSSNPLLATLRRRLLVRPRPGAWLGLVIRAFPRDDPQASPGDERPRTDDDPVHWLVSGWLADADGIVPRLPEFAAIASPDRERALAELLAHLPPEAPVFLTTPERVDAALVAELVLAIDRNLQPWHRDGLRAFIEARRDADRALIRELYTDRDEGFERLRRRLLESGGLDEGDGNEDPPAG